MALDRLHAMTVLVAVAEEQSFAAAARRLALSPPVVTRAVAALERRLGVKLLVRTTRFVRPTDAGQGYLESARRIVAEADEADAAAAGSHGAPRGMLKITAPVLFGSLYVMPSVAAFLSRFPDVSVSALIVDRVVNLLEEGIDVGVRIGDLPDSSMRAIPAGFVRRVVCASPRYLRKHRTPVAPGDLSGHTIIAATAVTPSGEWWFLDGKRRLTVRVRPRLTVTSNDSAIRAALQGFGVVRLMSYQVAEHLATGRLVRVLSAYEPPPSPIHVIHLEGRLASAALRGFVDLLVKQLRSEPALQQAGR